MRHRTRLAAIERKQAQRRPPVEWWIHYDPETAKGIENTTMAWSALRPGVLRPIADLTDADHRIVITYDRDMTP